MAWPVGYTAPGSFDTTVLVRCGNAGDSGRALQDAKLLEHTAGQPLVAGIKQTPGNSKSAEWQLLYLLAGRAG